MKICEKNRCKTCQLDGKAQLVVGAKKESCLFLIYGEVLRLITDALRTDALRMEKN